MSHSWDNIQFLSKTVAVRAIKQEALSFAENWVISNFLLITCIHGFEIRGHYLLLEQPLELRYRKKTIILLKTSVLTQPNQTET